MPVTLQLQIVCGSVCYICNFTGRPIQRLQNVYAVLIVLL